MDYRIIKRGKCYLVQRKDWCGWNEPSYGGGPFFDLRTAERSMNLLIARDESVPYTVVSSTEPPTND